MIYRIAMPLKQHLVTYLQEHKLQFPENVEITYFVYETIEQLCEIYEKIHSDFQGIITSGVIPNHVMEELRQGDTPCLSYLDIDIENTYRILLRESIRRRQQDFSRVAVDFMADKMTLPEAIEKNALATIAREYDNTFRHYGHLVIEEEEKRFSHYVEKKFKNGEIDFALTYLYTTAERMRGMGYSCYYIYPSQNALTNTVREVVSKIDAMRARRSYPANVLITCSELLTRKYSNTEMKFLAYKKEILTLVSPYSGSLTVKDSRDGFEIYTDCDTLAKLTNNFLECPFYTYLQKNLNFSGSIGYGIGRNFYQARMNAMDAVRHGENFGDENHRSFLIDEDNKMICMTPGSEADLVISDVESDYIYRVASEVKLSPETVSKIIHVLKEEGSDEISSLDLINRLGISTRTANRFLANLMKYGKAEIIGQKRIVPKGRPVNIYKIMLDY